MLCWSFCLEIHICKILPGGVETHSKTPISKTRIKGLKYSSIYILMTQDPEIIPGIYCLMTEDPEIRPGIYILMKEDPEIIPGSIISYDK